MNAIVKYADRLAEVDIKDAIDILRKNLSRIGGGIDSSKDAVEIYMSGNVIKSPDNKAVVIMNNDGRVEVVEDDTGSDNKTVDGSIAVRIYVKDYKGDLLVAAVLPDIHIDSIMDSGMARLKLIKKNG